MLHTYVRKCFGSSHNTSIRPKGTYSIKTLQLLFVHKSYSIVTVEHISSYKLVNTRNIMIVNQTQPVLLSQPNLKGKHTIYQLILDKK